jgi:hypothetical protein
LKHFKTFLDVGRVAMCARQQRSTSSSLIRSTTANDKQQPFFALELINSSSNDKQQLQ